MNISREYKIRPRFLASIALTLCILLLAGGWYTIGLWLPLSVMSVCVILTKFENVISLFPDRYYQIAFVIVLSLGFLVHLFTDVHFATSWYIASLMLSPSFKFVRHVLCMLGFIGPFTNA